MRGPYQTCSSGGGQIPGCVSFFLFRDVSYCFFLLSFTVTEMINYHYITNGCYLIQIKQLFYYNVLTKTCVRLIQGQQLCNARWPAYLLEVVWGSSYFQVFCHCTGKKARVMTIRSLIHYTFQYERKSVCLVN